MLSDTLLSGVINRTKGLAWRAGWRCESSRLAKSLVEEDHELNAENSFDPLLTYVVS